MSEEALKSYLAIKESFNEKTGTDWVTTLKMELTMTEIRLLQNMDEISGGEKLDLCSAYTRGLLDIM